MNIARFVVSCMPARLVNRLGRLQFEYPQLQPVLRRFARAASTGPTRISHGPAKGLLIDATYGFPGYSFGTSEPEQQQYLSKTLCEGDVVYEIGANVGFFAILCAKLIGKSGIVYAFEPLPVCAQATRWNASANGFSNLEVFEVAISDRSGQVFLDNSQESSALARVQEEQSASGSVPVEAITLDALVDKAALRKPSMLMIDVEGHEISVLKGAAKLIAKFHPKILCEVHWLGHQFTDYFEQELKPLGYEMTNLEGGKVPADPVRWHALIAIP